MGMLTERTGGISTVDGDEEIDKGDGVGKKNCWAVGCVQGAKAWHVQ